MTDTPTIPEGYKADNKGNLVPEANIKPIDKLRDETVLDLVSKARKCSRDLKRFKSDCFDVIHSFVELSAAEYGVSLGGKKGNVTLMSFDGRYKIQRAVAEHQVFDERLTIAKELIDQCIEKWSEGTMTELRKLVDHAFQKDKAGKVNTGRILSLRRIDITDPDWIKAMEAIADSITSNSTSTYVRLYERVGESDHYRQIPLDLASV